MPKGTDVNLDVLHRLLYERSDRLGRVRVVQHVLAEELGITKFTMSRVFSRMLEEHRIDRIGAGKHIEGRIEVMDPELWDELYGTV